MKVKGKKTAGYKNGLVEVFLQLLGLDSCLIFPRKVKVLDRSVKKCEHFFLFYLWNIQTIKTIHTVLIFLWEIFQKK